MDDERQMAEHNTRVGGIDDLFRAATTSTTLASLPSGSSLLVIDDAFHGGCVAVVREPLRDNLPTIGDQQPAFYLRWATGWLSSLAKGSRRR